MGSSRAGRAMRSWCRAWRIASLVALLTSGFTSMAMASDCSTASGNRRGIAGVPDVRMFESEFGDRTLGRALQWRERLELFTDRGASFQPTQGVRVLARVGGENGICGFVDSADVIWHRPGQPMTAYEIRGREEGALLSDDGDIVLNEWSVKAVLRSNPKEIVENDAMVAPIYQQPARIGKPTTSRVFGLYNIWDVRRGEDSSTEDWWFFIGGENLLNHNTLAGWVQGKHLFLWESSVALHANPDAPNGGEAFKVYDSFKSLRAQTPNGLLSSGAELESPEDRDIPKFPVLRPLFDSREARQAGADPRAYEIGFFGQGCADGECLGASEIGGRLARIGQLVDQAGNIDFLFVIDNTESMRKYFPEIGKAVSTWAADVVKERAKTGAKGIIRFGAAVYGDYNNPSGENWASDGLDFHVLANLSARGADAIARELQNVPLFKDSRVDPPEAGYAAIVRAARSVQWSPNAAYKLVIWIGDMGVRPAGLGDPVSDQQVRTALIENDLFFAAINVAGQYRENQTRTFLSDAAAILSNSGAEQSKSVAGIEPIATCKQDDCKGESPIAAAEQVTSVLTSVFADAIGVKASIQGRRQRELGTDSPSADSTPAAPAAPTIMDIPSVKLVDTSRIRQRVLERYGLSEHQIDQYMKLNQLMDRGYVEFDKVNRNLGFFAATDTVVTFGQLQTMLRSTCDAMGGDDLGTRLIGVLTNLAFTLGGDDFDRTRETPAQYLARRLFIPKQHFPTWLDKSPDEIDTVWRTANSRTRLDMRFNVCRSYFLLNMIERNQKIPSIDLIVWDDEALGTLRVKDETKIKEFRWIVGTDTQIASYYIPVEYLPGGAN